MGLDTASSEVNERKLHDVPMNSTTNADAAHQKGMQNIYLLFEERFDKDNEKVRVSMCRARE